MAEDKITHDMISDSDPFKYVTSGADKALEAANRLEAGLKSIVKTLAKGLGADPKSMADLKSQVQSINNIAAGEKALNEVGRQKLLLTQALNAEILERKKREQELTLVFREQLQKEKEKAAAAKKTQDAYSKLSQRHKELVRDVKNLAAAGREESKLYKTLIADANKLDAQLKKIDGSLGQHTRKVGQYENAWKGVAQGFQNFLGTVGISVGIGAVIGGLKSSVQAFVEAEKHAHQLRFALTQVAGEGAVAFNKLIEQSERLQASGGIFSDDDIQGAQTQLINYGLLSDEVEELIPKIMDLATAQGVDLATATDTVIKGINGQTKGLKTVGLGFEDTGDRAENYSIILEKLDKFQGAAAASATTVEGKYLVLQNRFDDLQEDIGEFLITSGYEFLQFWDALTTEVTFADYAIQQMNDSMQKFANLRLEKDLEGITGTREEQISEMERRMDSLAKKASDISEQNRQGLIEDEDYVEQITFLTNLRLGYEKEIARLKTQEQPTDFNSRTGDADGSKATKQADDWEAAWLKALEEVEKAREAAYRDEEARAQKRLDIEKRLRQLEVSNASETAKETARYLDELAELDALAAEAKEAGIFDQERYNRDLEAIEREHFDNMEAIQDAADKKELDDANEQKEKLKKIKEKEAQDLIRLEEQVLGAIDEGLEERYRKREKQLERDGNLIDEQLRIQSERQLAGLDNTYSEVLKMKEENDAKLEALEEARRKKEEAKDLAELFIELTKANAKDGKAQDAAMKALAQTIAIKALSNTIAGNFAEGVENFKGKGGPTDDANIIGFSSGESVVTAKGTQDTAGLVTAVNERGKAGAIDWAMDQIYKPQFAGALAPEDVIGGSSQPDLYSSLVLNQLVDVNKKLSDLPKKSWGYDETEKAFYSIVKNQGKTTKTIKRRF